MECVWTSAYSLGNRGVCQQAGKEEHFILHGDRLDNLAISHVGVSLVHEHGGDKGAHVCDGRGGKGATEDMVLQESLDHAGVGPNHLSGIALQKRREGLVRGGQDRDILGLIELVEEVREHAKEGSEIARRLVASEGIPEVLLGGRGRDERSEGKMLHLHDGRKKRLVTIELYTEAIGESFLY